MVGGLMGSNLVTIILEGNHIIHAESQDNIFSAMRKLKGLTSQERHFLEVFIQKLDRRLITTLELISFLLIIRDYSKGEVLREWCHGAAHRKRDRGKTATAGMELYSEVMYLNKYFSEHPESQVNCIPKRIFESIINFLQNNDFGKGGVGLTYFYPDGYSIEELIASIQFMYRLDKKTNSFSLIESKSNDPSDLQVIKRVAPLVEQTLWGATPLFFDEIFDEIISTTSQLLGKGKRILKKREKLFTLHFLCCFHLTEIKDSQQLKYPCFLALDETASECLSLNLALYEKTSFGNWEQVELIYEDRGKHQSGSHRYSRPYLITDLKVDRYFSGEILGLPAIFLSPISVITNRKTEWIQRCPCH